MKLKNLKAGLLDMWLRNFWAALVVLFVVKIAAMGVNIFSPATRGAHPFYKYVLKSFLIFGSDIFGAALFAAAVALLCIPFLIWKKRRIRLGISMVAQVGHAFFGTFSFFTVVFIGGPINKSLLDLAIMSEPENTSVFGPELMKSIGEYVTPVNAILLLATMVLGAAAVLLSPRFYKIFRGLKLKFAVVILLTELVATMVAMPFLASGEIGGIRIYTYGLEESPAVGFTWSYLKSMQTKWQIDEGLIDDQFELSMVGYEDRADLSPAPMSRAIPKKTNVILVAMESIGAPYLEEEDQTPMPFYRELQGSPGAQNFANNYATWSLTSKAFFSIFCSELPYPTYKAESLVNPSIPSVSLSEVLHDNGYYTAILTGQDLAYDRQMRFFQHRKLDLVLDHRSMPGVEEKWEGDWGLDDRLVIKNMFDVIDEQKKTDPDKPFFVFYGMTAGHHPFMACKEHERNPLGDRVANYMRALGFVDDRIRDIFNGLKERGIADDTLVVIFSDHGDGHGRYVGRNAWQPVIKVPLIMVGPQLGDIAAETELVTSHMDVAPTMLALLGLPIPCTMKGRDLTREGDHRIALFGGRPPKWQLGLTDGKWKFIWEDRKLEMLFDLTVDPGENNNLAAKHTKRVEAYKLKIDQWSAYSTNLIENYADILDLSDCQPNK